MPRPTYTYDYNPSSGPNGTLSTETHTNTNGSPSSISRTFTHSQYGELTSATDFTNNTSSQTKYSNFACASTTAFPGTITLPTVSSDSYTPSLTLHWDCNGGVMTSIEDNNNQTTTTYTYNDPNNFWRLTKTTYADNGADSVTYTDTQGAYSVARSKAVTSVENHTVTSIPGRSRARQNISRRRSVQRRVQHGGHNVRSLGRVYSVSNPYYSGSGSSVTIYSYDALNRIQLISYPDTSVTTQTYPGNCATSTDPASKVTNSARTGWGGSRQSPKIPAA